MSFERLLIHTVTVRRPGTSTDRYGNATKDWDTATDTDVAAWVHQTSAGEEGADEGREAQLTRWQLFVPASTDIVAGDRVVWETTTFEVDGVPAPAYSPRGEHHLEVQILAVEG